MTRKLKAVTPSGEAKTYAYCRVSTARQASDGDSLEAQRRMIEGYAAMHDLTINEIVVEEGVSGSIAVEDRPAAGALFAKLQRGDVLIAAKLDRLFRSARDALNVVEALKAKGVSLHLLDLGGDISGNGLSRLFLTIAAAFAEAERDRIRERIGDAKLDQKRRGLYLGGSRPFGFDVVEIEGSDDRRLVRNEVEQASIAEIIKLKRKGKSLRETAAALRRQGRTISAVTVASVLKRELSPETLAALPPTRSGRKPRAARHTDRRQRQQAAP
jgi:DNA invertase Pin-like site-specific DNA recombinase